MNHEQYTENLSAYLDGELGSSERAELERHLPDCTGCREKLIALRETSVLLKRHMMKPAPPGLATRVLAQAQEKPRWAFRTHLWKPAFAVAIAAAGLFLFYQSGFLMLGRKQNMPEVSLSVSSGQEAARSTPQTFQVPPRPSPPDALVRGKPIPSRTPSLQKAKKRKAETYDMLSESPQAAPKIPMEEPPERAWVARKRSMASSDTGGASYYFSKMKEEELQITAGLQDKIREALIIRNRKQWEEFWKLHSKEAAPQINLQGRMLVIPQTGFLIEMMETQSKKIIIYLKENPAKSKGEADLLMLNPKLLPAPASDLPIEFLKR